MLSRNLFSDKVIKPITPAMIDTLEKSIGSVLPIDYKAYLLNFNGLRPIKTVCPLSLINDSTTIGGMHDINTLNHIIFDNYIDGFSVIKNKLLPIAHDVYGNLLCIGLDKKNFGKVYFYDHEKPPRQAFREKILVADSFTIFIGQLELESAYIANLIKNDPEFARRVDELRKNNKFRQG